MFISNNLSSQCRELNKNSNLWEIKQIEKTHVKENNYMHKTIFTICLCPRSCRYFIIVREKEIQGVATVFLLRNTTTNKTLISKLRFLHPTHKIYNGLQNRPKKISGLGHGISLKKFLIKKAHNIIRVGSSNRIKQN